MKKVVLTGGGTAGHVTPNIALLPGLKQAGFSIWYIGSNGIERSLIEREELPFITISTGKLRRYFDLKNFTDLFKIVCGFFQSIIHLIRIRPDVVFSKGGFVAVPVVWAAGLLRIPVLIHESDNTPGLANRLSIPFATKICFSFPETARYLPAGKCVLTGVPIRKELYEGSIDKGKSFCGFSDDKPVLLIIGGSLGSLAINSIVRESLDLLCNEFNVCHLCGKGNSSAPRDRYAQFEYVTTELPDLFALADCVISRAGATTLFELLALQKPSLLIPLGAGSRGDQILNANSFEKQGFSKVLMQEQLTKQTLVENVQSVMADRKKMVEKMGKYSVSDSTGTIIKLIESLI